MIFYWFSCTQTDSPIWNFHLIFPGLSGLSNIFAAGQLCSCPASRIGKKFFCIIGLQDFSIFHNCCPATEIINFIPAVTYQQHILSIPCKDVFYLYLQQLPQIRIQGAERLIQQKHLRLTDQDPGQGRPLLLSSAELSRIQLPLSRKVHFLQHFFHFLSAKAFILFPG